MTSVYDPPIPFRLYDWDGKLAHKASSRASNTDDLPQVIRWRGRTFITRNEPVDREFEEAATLTLDDDDGVFAPVKPAPTLEDVDAELQPEGLPVLQWDAQSPAWAGNWLPSFDDGRAFVRAFITAPKNGNYTPNMHFATVFEVRAGHWTHVTANPQDYQDITYDHPTPEAAQAACEAAIVAAWRNR